MKVVGIDFGHGETSASIFDEQSVLANDLYVVGEKKCINSIICIFNDNKIINPDAALVARADEIGVYFKAPLVESEEYSQITPQNREYFKEFCHQVYNSIKNNPLNALHNVDFSVYVASPSGWNEEQMSLYKQFLRDDCTIPAIDIIKESKAAFIGARHAVGGTIKVSDNVLVVDFGSSTVDFTFFSNNNRCEPVHKGYPFGAHQVEKAVLEYIKKDNHNAQENIRNAIQLLGGTERAENKVNNALLFKIRQQKEDFFSNDRENFIPTIDLGLLLGYEELRYKCVEASGVNGYSKESLKIILCDYIQNLSEMLDDFNCQIDNQNINKLILTGGASRMFFFKELLLQKYPECELVSDGEFRTRVSRGIATYGYLMEKSQPIKNQLYSHLFCWESELPKLLRSSIEKIIGLLYSRDLKLLISEYETGSVEKDGVHSLDVLRQEMINKMEGWIVSGEELSASLSESVESAINESLTPILSDLSELWKIQMPTINVKLNFDKALALSPVTTRHLQSKIFWDWISAIINQRHFFKFDKDTSPYKDRGSKDRSIIMSDLTEKIDDFFNRLEYKADLTNEIDDILSQIDSQIERINEEIELQQYR